MEEGVRAPTEEAVQEALEDTEGALEAPSVKEEATPEEEVDPEALVNREATGAVLMKGRDSEALRTTLRPVLTQTLLKE